MSHPPVHAALLAAGSGRRLGLPKAALQLRGVWALPHLVRTLKQGGAHSVVLVLSELALDAIADLGHPGADREARNPDPDAGRTGSLQCGYPDNLACARLPNGGMCDAQGRAARSRIRPQLVVGLVVQRP